MRWGGSKTLGDIRDDAKVSFLSPNDPSSAAAATRRADCNRDGPPPVAAMLDLYLISFLPPQCEQFGSIACLTLWQDGHSSNRLLPQDGHV